MMPLFSQTCAWKPKALPHILVATRSLATKQFSIPALSLKADWKHCSMSDKHDGTVPAEERTKQNTLNNRNSTSTQTERRASFVSAKCARLMRLQKHGLATQLGNAQTGHDILWPLCVIHFKWWQGDANSLPSLIFYRFLDGTSFSDKIQAKRDAKAAAGLCALSFSLPFAFSFAFSLLSLSPQAKIENPLVRGSFELRTHGEPEKSSAEALSFCLLRFLKSSFIMCRLMLVLYARM